jgi:hypothetical protein
MTQLVFSTFFSETKMPELAELTQANYSLCENYFSRLAKTSLFTQTQLGDQRNVTVMVFTVQIGQQALTAVNHAQQAATTVVVFGMQLEMGGEFVDTSGQQSHLDFGATCIVSATRIGLDDFGFNR